MKLLDEILNVHEIVVDTTLLGKGTLALGDNRREDRDQSVSKQLGEDF